MELPKFQTDVIRKNFDIACDFIPFVSTVNSCIDLIQKNKYYAEKINGIKDTAFPNANANNNCYYEHLGKKHNLRCIVTLVPVAGNLGLALYLGGKKAFHLGKQVLLSILSPKETEQPISAEQKNPVFVEQKKNNETIVREKAQSRHEGPSLPTKPEQPTAKTKSSSKKKRSKVVAPDKASDDQKKDKAIVREWVRKNPKNFQYADISLRDDSLFIRQLIVECKDPTILEFAEQVVRIDRTTIELVASIDPKALAFADPFLLDDPDFMIALVEQNNLNENQTIEERMEKRREIIKHISRDLMEDPEFQERLAGW